LAPQTDFDLEACLEGLASKGPVRARASNAFVTHFAPRFGAFLLARRVPPADAEEIVQDILIRACVTQTDKLRQSRYPIGYLWRMLQNAHLDYRRAQQIAGRQLSESTLGEETFRAIMMNVIGDDGDRPLREDYVRCVLSVLARFRQAEPLRALAIELQATEGLSSDELAEILEKPTAGAAREFLSQARQALSGLASAECGSRI
jgi:DNA-directed RNA polymerase specialized sigma24 family protein